MSSSDTFLRRYDGCIKLFFMWPIEHVDVHAFTVPTDAPEADGTLAWRQTTIVVVEAHSDGAIGIGYSYGDAVIAQFIKTTLLQVILKKEAQSIPLRWSEMVRATRNAGRPGLVSHAIAAMDIALWDLKANLLGLPLVTLLGQARQFIPIYGSGGFTSYSIDRLKEQLGGWVEQGIGMVKMKVGMNPQEDFSRVKAARDAIGLHPALFVDANGAYTRKQALFQAMKFAEYDVSWFEEPVSSDDLEGLKLLRDRAPAGMAIAAGEYGYDTVYFRRMLEAGAVDILQADATRCMGVTGFMKAAALCEAWMIPLSAHTAPTIHAHLCCAAQPACHVEYFHDHVRIEQMLFDGALVQKKGALKPDLSASGLGIRLRRSEVKHHAA